MFELSDEMRNTRQGPLGSEGSDAPALQQFMETMRAFQEANEEAKAEQESRSNRFNVLKVRLQTHNEEMMIVTFEWGMTKGPFSDSLIRNPTKTFSKVV